MHFKDMEYINCENMLRCIESELESPSRTQVAKHLGISNTTASQIASKLIQRKLVRENGSSFTDKRGRPGRKLELNPSYWVALGASFTSRRFIFVVLNLLGEMVETFSIRVPDLSLESSMETLRTGLSILIKKYKRRVIPAIGISLPGIVNPETGVLVRADDLDWIEVNIGDYIQTHFGKPAYVINRYWASGLAEYRLVAEKHIRNFLYIGLGTDIGSAIMINGELVTGQHFSAGKLGHVVIDGNGQICSCGKKGCLQTVVTQAGLLSHIKEKIEASIGSQNDDPFINRYLEEGKSIDLDMLKDMVDASSSIAEEGLEYIGKLLSIAIGNLVQILDPEKIMLGGHLPIKFPKITEVVQNELIPHYSEASLDIALSKLGDMGSAIGAAMGVLDRKFALLADKL
jgi:predicted NBD/HSP70 family sugar kinase